MKSDNKFVGGERWSRLREAMINDNIQFNKVSERLSSTNMVFRNNKFTNIKNSREFLQIKLNFVGVDKKSYWLRINNWGLTNNPPVSTNNQKIK